MVANGLARATTSHLVAVGFARSFHEVLGWITPTSLPPCSLDGYQLEYGLHFDHAFYLYHVRVQRWVCKRANRGFPKAFI